MYVFQNNRISEFLFNVLNELYDTYLIADIFNATLVSDPLVVKLL